MPQAQFDFASDLPGQAQAQSTALDAWTKLGANARAQRARKIFAGNLDEKGRLNESGFYKNIAESGLGAEDAGAAMDWYHKGKSADVATALANLQLRAQGVDPNAQGRAGAEIGEPTPVEVPAAEPKASGYDLMTDRDIGGVPAVAPKARGMADWWDKLRGKQSAEEPQPGAEPSTDMGAIGSSSLATGQLPPLPEGAGSPATLRPGQDNRSARQMVEDSYKPENTLAARSAPTQQPSEGEASLFEWNAVDNGSNQFQQFSQALGAKLKGIGAVDAQGIPNPSKYLQQIYSSTVMANMPPAPNTALLNQGLEGMSKYEGEVQKYAAEIQKAKGLAQSAVLKAKSDLVDYAKQFGVDTVEQRKSEIPGGMLRDPAKRTEAAALVTNKQNIANAAHAVEAAVDANGPNVTKLMLAAPQVIRAYATALNPGQQLGEGNLLEVSRVMYPDITGPKLISVATALGRGLRNNDWSGFKTISDAIDATAPQALFQRMQTLTREADKLNQISLSSYVTPSGTPKRSTSEALGDAVGIKPKAGKAGTISAPIDLSTGTEPAVGQYYIYKGKVMRRDK